MRKIILYGPAVDRLDRFRDAGSELTVGDAAGADISETRADELVRSGRAAKWTDAKKSEAAARGEAFVDPLDHDADGRKGGVARSGEITR